MSLKNTRSLIILTIQNRILLQKLNLYHHISCLPHSSLSHRILETMKRLHLPGLYEECRPFLLRHVILDVASFSKHQWRLFVRHKINEENRQFLISWSEKYKKIDTLQIACEDYKFKDYFFKLNLAQSRLMFRSRSGCMYTCKTQYSSDPVNMRALHACMHCREVDTFSPHWMNCNAYAHLRKSRNLQIDSQLLAYYQDIINLRVKTLDES